MQPPNTTGSPTATPTTFGPADRDELHRWASAAQTIAGWFVQRPDGGMIAQTDTGQQYAVLTVGSPDRDGVLMVQPGVCRWELRDADGLTFATFGTLREALESVCPTI